jgi:predicted PurR-regulated permease PerM
MTESTTLLKRWIAFAGSVLIVAVLYWAQAVLVPLAVAVLLTFVLTPVVAWIERWSGRAVAVVLVVLLAFGALGTGSWVVAHELTAFADSLPAYRANIRQKVADVRGAGRGGSVEKVQKTLEQIKSDIEAGDGRTSADRPVVVEPQQVASLWGFPSWLSPLVEPLSTASLVIVLVIFMLIERQDLRDRLISVIGRGHVTLTTRAFDEAATRVSRYLLMQSLVNLVYGTGVALGLYFLQVPYFPLWACLAALLRFIPYVGPLIGAGAPILVSLAAYPGWHQPLLVVALFVGLELFTNLVLETFLYAGAAGVSQVPLLVAVAFWTWLWGPMGLLLATPLTVCLVVVGKHVPGLQFISTLMADAPALSPDVRFYQRLLARDQSEAADLVEAHVENEGLGSAYDALLVPSLNYAERDRLEDRLTAEEEAAIVAMTAELADDAAAQTSSTAAEGEALAEARVGVLGYGVNSDADVLALRMLTHLLRGSPAAIEIASARVLASEVVRSVAQQNYRIVCIADLPPSPPSKTRYLIRKLRAAFPDLKIVVGRWGPPGAGVDETAALREAGADAVAMTLVETHDHLHQLAQLAAVSSGTAAA